MYDLNYMKNTMNKWIKSWFCLVLVMVSDFLLSDIFIDNIIKMDSNHMLKPQEKQQHQKLCPTCQSVDEVLHLKLFISYCSIIIAFCSNCLLHYRLKQLSFPVV